MDSPYQISAPHTLRRAEATWDGIGPRSFEVLAAADVFTTRIDFRNENMTNNLHQREMNWTDSGAQMAASLKLASEEQFARTQVASKQNCRSETKFSKEVLLRGVELTDRRL